MPRRCYYRCRYTLCAIVLSAKWITAKKTVGRIQQSFLQLFSFFAFSHFFGFCISDLTTWPISKVNCRLRQNISNFKIQYWFYNYNNDFESIIAIIEQSKARAFRAVNAEMIEMYWQIGKYISEKSNNDDWGKSVVQDFANFSKQAYPTASGFSAQNMWRMKQFYETYKDNEKLSPPMREITWSNNLLIMSSCKTEEAIKFYLRLTPAVWTTKFAFLLCSMRGYIGMSYMSAAPSQFAGNRAYISP